jgi:hypothetical protein
MFSLKGSIHDYGLILPFCTYEYKHVLKVCQDLHDSNSTCISPSKWNTISKVLRLEKKFADVYWDALTSIINIDMKNMEIFVLLLFQQTYFNYKYKNYPNEIKDECGFECQYPINIRVERQKLNMFWRNECMQWISLLSILQTGEIGRNIKFKFKILQALDYFFVKNDEKLQFQFCEKFSRLIMEVFPSFVGLDIICNWIKKELGDLNGYYILNTNNNGLSVDLKKFGQTASNNGTMMINFSSASRK